MTRGQGLSALLFISPVVIILGLFLLVPIVMAAWVSVSDWSGRGSPFGSGVHFVGLRNYRAFGSDGLARNDLMTSVRNNFYFVVLVVPLQTVLALGWRWCSTRAGCGPSPSSGWPTTSRR